MAEREKEDVVGISDDFHEIVPSKARKKTKYMTTESALSILGLTTIRKNTCIYFSKNSILSLEGQTGIALVEMFYLNTGCYIKKGKK